MRISIHQTDLELIQGDITQVEADAIVNAANEQLAHGGGVAGAIARNGGPTIQQESNEWVRLHGPVPTGSAALTSAGRLPARYVIHAVGPVYDGTEQSAHQLASAVRSALQLADERRITSIALPAISTGIFGYPMEEAAEVMLRSAIQYLQERRETNLTHVLFCLYSPAAFDTFSNTLLRLTSADAPEMG